MTLDIGKDIFKQGIFKNSPNDSDTLIFQGNKQIPSGNVGGNQIKSPGTMADDATVGTEAWSDVNQAKVSDNIRTLATVDIV